MTTSLASLAPQQIAASDQLGLSGRLVEDHYTLPLGTPVEAWLLDGEILQAMEKRIGFWLGDWLRSGEERYGNERYTQALQATGHAVQTLKNAKHVAGRFPVETRVHEGLAFGHYSAASGLPAEDAHELLEQAAELKLSTKDLRDRVRHRQDQLKAIEHAQKPVPRTEISGVDLWVGDALSLTLDDGVVDLIVTSPPYALRKEYTEGGDISTASWFDFITAACAEAYRVTKRGGRFALNIPLDTTLGGNRPTYAEAVAAGLASGWRYRSTIVWIDEHLGKSTARGSYDALERVGTAAAPSIIAPAEMIILFSKDAWWRETPPDRPSYIDKDDWLGWTNGSWTFPGESRPWEDHPAPFPEELPTRLIHLLSFPGDLVLDPFMGSGTTAIAAIKAGRRVVGVDASQTYINASLRRVAALLATHPGLTEMS